MSKHAVAALMALLQLSYFEAIASAGVAVILVTHDFGIVAANADRVAVMYAGRIVEIGTTLEIFDDPRHPYTRALLRCLPTVDRERLGMYLLRQAECHIERGEFEKAKACIARVEKQCNMTVPVELTARIPAAPAEEPKRPN